MYKDYDEYDSTGGVSEGAIKKAKLVAFILSGLLLALLFNPFVIVGPGERGVVLCFGEVQDTVLDEGIHFRVPIYQRIIKMDVKVQKEEVGAAAVSKDLQTVSSKVALNFHINPSSAAGLYQTVGLEFPNRIIAPAMQEAVKATTAKFTAEELVTKREDVAMEVKERIAGKLQPYGIVVDVLNMTNFDFSKEFNAAIEAKQVAEQQALKAKRDLDRIKVEAEQKVAAAQAEAESLRLQRSQITPELIQKQMVEKWDGHYPQTMVVTGDKGAMPIINLPQASAK